MKFKVPIITYSAVDYEVEAPTMDDAVEVVLKIIEKNKSFRHLNFISTYPNYAIEIDRDTLFDRIHNYPTERAQAQYDAEYEFQD